MDQIGLSINTRGETSDEELVSIAQLADQQGYHSFWAAESWGRDAFTVLTMIACHTQQLRLATGIVNVFSRTPAIIAQTIASLDILSKGRAILGLGSSGKAVVEGWHGVPFDSPVARTREYIEIIRQALSGAPVNHQGKFYRMDRFRMIAPPVQERLPIYIASLGPKNLSLTGEVADGWLPVWANRERLPDLLEQISLGAAKSGRSISDVTVAPYLMSYTADGTEDLAHGERLLKAHMAYYIGGMGTFYFESFSRAGFAAEAQAVRDAWNSRDREQAAAAVSDRMLESVAVLGDAQQCRDQMAKFRQAGIDIPILTFPHGAELSAIHRTIKALAPQAVAQ
ncbi:MAG: LLM class flavin-dependent oxidoreductase [Chloroflexi bacterium]|nr:LLM class flavin-dependent oxidoreductase [Chloroflexota bacterium]